MYIVKHINTSDRFICIRYGLYSIAEKDLSVLTLYKHDATFILTCIHVHACVNIYTISLAIEFLVQFMVYFITIHLCMR